MRNLFKEAHKMTKEIAKEYKVDYKAQFAICLRYLFKKQNKKIELAELKGTERQVKWANDIRNKMLKQLEKLKNAEEHRRYYFGRDITIEEIEDAIEYIKNIDDSKFYIENRYEEGIEIVILIENRKKVEETLKQIKKLELAKLEGTEKQVIWANNIRDKKLKRLAEIEDIKWNEYYDDYKKEDIIKVIATKITDAKVFIDNEDAIDDLVRYAIKISK